MIVWGFRLRGNLSGMGDLILRVWIKKRFSDQVGPSFQKKLWIKWSLHILQVAESETGDESSRVLDIFNEDGDSNVVLLRSSTRG